MQADKRLRFCCKKPPSGHSEENTPYKGRDGQPRRGRRPCGGPGRRMVAGARVQAVEVMRRVRSRIDSTDTDNRVYRGAG